MATTKKTTTKRKPATKKRTTTGTSTKTTKSTPEDQITDQTLKLIDQAAAALRKTARTGGSTALKARTEAHKKAQSLLGQAHSGLSSVLNKGNSVLKSGLNRLAP